MKAQAAYYRDRVLDYLDQFGFPLRRRALLFFARPTNSTSASRSYGEEGTIELVTTERLRSLNWPADPGTIAESSDWQGAGQQWAVAARRHDTLQGFCWLEQEAADLRFFDLQWPLPAGACYMSRAWVLPECRNQGIGRKLIDFAAVFAKELGDTRILSTCVPENLRMRHLLAESDWTYRGRVDYLRAGPLMRYTLRPAASQSSSYHSANTITRKLTEYLSR